MIEASRICCADRENNSGLQVPTSGRMHTENLIVIGGMNTVAVRWNERLSNFLKRRTLKEEHLMHYLAEISL